MGLFGGGDKEMEMPTPQEYFDQAQGYYENYRQWTGDETARYERDVATNRARYGASGSAADNPMLNKVNEARTTSYHEAMSDLEGGEHGKYLTQYYNAVKENVLKDYAPRKKVEKGTGILAGVDMDYWADDAYGTSSYFSDVDVPGRGQARELQDKIFNLEEAGRPQTAMGGSIRMNPETQGEELARTNQLAALTGQLEGLRTTAETEMTMDRVFGSKFGGYEEKGPAEAKAIERARGGAGGRAAPTDTKLGSTSWWG